MYVVLRRLVLMALVGAAGFAGYTLWRRTTGESGHTPEWPPLTTATAPSAGTPDASTNGHSAAPTAPAADRSNTAATTSTAHDAAPDETAVETPGDASDPPGPLTSPDGATWVPAVEGECPIEHPIKANDNSGIYHVPGGRFYDRTRAERCYARPEDADADGYRPAKA